MRFVFGVVLSVLLLAWLALPDTDGAAAVARTLALPDQSLIIDAKFVCGDFGEGYTCRRESGAIRRGKMPKVPSAGSSSGSSSSGGGGWFGGSDDEDSLPPPAPAAGSTSTGDAASGACPPNSERLGGHCIPYTQTCSKGLAANAPPQVCQSAEEKLVCDFRADGLKDCCCRTYSKF
jgi:hypothetical protein